jgi:hypothetical protein
MPELTFRVEGAEPVPFAAAPAMSFRMSAENRPSDQKLHNVLLLAQIRIEANRRRYTDAEKARLAELFGESGRWDQTLRPLLWSHASVVVSPFTGSTVFDLQVPCTFDFNVAATKYFEGLSAGSIPLLFLFSGTVFYADGAGGLQAAPIPWSQEVRFELPALAWRELMASYYPNTAWITIRKDVLDKLRDVNAKDPLAGWEQAAEALLSSPELRSTKELIAP